VREKQLLLRVVGSKQKSGKAVWEQKNIQEFLFPGFVLFSLFLCVTELLA